MRNYIRDIESILKVINKIITTSKSGTKTLAN